MFVHDQALPYFIDLQNRMIDIFPFVSCHEKNFKTYSIKIESLFVDVCSFFDSLCQTYICEQHTQGYIFKSEANVTNFQKKLAKDEFFNASDYRILLEDTFILSAREVGINNYEGQLVVDAAQFFPTKEHSYIIEPFREWAGGGNTDWWKAYTKLKHNRLANHFEATLKNLLYAMAGTYIIITLRHIEFFQLGGTRDLYRAFIPWYWQSGSGIAASLGKLEAKP